MPAFSDLTAKDLMVSDFTSIDASEPLSKVIFRIQSFKSMEALVFDEEKYLGNISLNSISRSGLTFLATHAHHAVVSYPKLSLDTPVLKIAEHMYYGGAHVLPVMGQDKVIGVVPFQKLLKLIPKLSELSSVKVKDVVDSAVLTVNETESIARVIKLMRSNAVEKIPVLSNNKLAGIVFLYDVLDKYGLKKTADTKVYHAQTERANAIWHAPEKVDVLKNSLSSDLVRSCPSCSLLTPLSEAASLFDSQKGLVVTENNAVKGIVTNRSFLRALLQLNASTRNLQVSDFPEVDELDKSKAENLLGKYYDKFEKILGPGTYMTVHFKTHAKQGVRRKHSVHAKVQNPNFSFQADKNSWNFLTAIQQTFTVLEKKVLKKMKSFPSSRKNSTRDKFQRQK